MLFRSGIELINNTMPDSYVLTQNYPNPFNPSTTINFSVTKTSFVTLKVYDLLGRLVAVLVDKEIDFGNYKVQFNAQNLSSGVYIYRIEAGRYSNAKKLILMK